MKNKEFSYEIVYYCWWGLIILTLLLAATSCATQKKNCLEKQINYRKAKKGMVKYSQPKPQKNNRNIYLFGWKLNK